MDFNLSDEQKAFREVVRRFADKELEPRAAEIDQTGAFPHDLRPKIAALNLYGILHPEAYGGVNAGYMAMTISQIELARSCPAIAMHIQDQSIVGYEINQYASEKQKQDWLVPIIKGEKLGFFAFTEPATGSDPNMLETRARSVEGGYVLNGVKRFITSGPIAQVGVVFAKDDSGDVSLFLVETDRPGFSAGQTYEKLGHRGATLSDIYMDNVSIPKENLLRDGNCFKELRSAMTLGKLCLSSQCVGIMQAALDEAMRYAQTRVQRGHPIWEFQHCHYLITEIATLLEAARLLTYQLAWQKDQGVDAIKQASITKLFASQAAVMATKHALQVHGSYGYLKEFKVERLFRDARGYELFEGVSEVQREILASRLAKEYGIPG